MSGHGIATLDDFLSPSLAAAPLRTATPDRAYAALVADLRASR